MRGGRIVQVGTARELYEAPRSAFVAQFIGRVNLLPARVRRLAEGRALVDLWGREVPVALDGAAPGQALHLVLRPESVRLWPAAAPPPADAVSLPGTVRSRTFLGEKVEYAVEAAGTTLQAVTWDPLRTGVFDEGAAVLVGCDPASLRPLADDAAAA
jgi:ABC-type Fe3+/spermidine/putrescine transport system ATPase subunit